MNNLSPNAKKLLNRTPQAKANRYPQDEDCRPDVKIRLPIRRQPHPLPHDDIFYFGRGIGCL